MIPLCVGWLLDDAAVAAIAGDRAYLDSAPPKTVAPYIIVSVITGIPENVIDGDPGIDNWRIQTDSYADADDGGAQCLALAAAVRAVYLRHGQMIGVGMVGKEVETSLFRYGEDWSFWIHR